jgi:hypothetical protein
LPRETIIIRATKIGGQFYAEQWSGFRYRLGQRAPGARITDCVPQSARF